VVRQTRRRKAHSPEFGSVPDLITAIEAYLNANNANPEPFVWTATADAILEKVRRGRVALQTTAG
jgi:hypothetical protein